MTIQVQPPGTYCPMTWPNGGWWFTHECGREPGHDGRHTCDHPGCLSWTEEALEAEGDD